jgi:salicylate hydroxylase
VTIEFAPDEFQDMVTLLPEGTFHMNKRLRDLVKRPSGGFAVTFDDGTEVEADAVIGSDGIKSKTRQILLGEDNPDAYPKYSGEFGYRGLVPMNDAIEVLGEDFAKNGNVNVGNGALTTTYPVEKGSMLNIVAARDQPTWDDPNWVVPADKESIQEEFKDYGPKMKQVVSLLKEPQKWSLWHHPTAPTFYSGRLAIIGDAAHASTPHQGAGCGQAFEDALVMCELLAHDNVKTADDIESAFTAYDAVRRPRTLRVVETSRENGEVCMMKGPDTKDDLTKIKKNLDKRFEWIWYENLDKQVFDAFRKLNQLTGSSLVESPRPALHRRNQHDQAAATIAKPGFLRGDSFAAETAALHHMVKV